MIQCFTQTVLFALIPPGNPAGQLLWSTHCGIGRSGLKAARPPAADDHPRPVQDSVRVCTTDAICCQGRWWKPKGTKPCVPSVLAGCPPIFEALVVSFIAGGFFVVFFGFLWIFFFCLKFGNFIGSCPFLDKSLIQHKFTVYFTSRCYDSP